MGVHCKPIEPLTTEQSELVKNHWALSRKQARSFHRRIDGVLPLEELRDVSLIAMCRAAKRYRPDGGCAFTTYCYLRIWRDLRNYYAGVCKRLRVLYPLAVSQCDNSGDAWQPALSAERRPDLRVEDLNALDFVRRSMPARYWRFLTLYYVDGLKHREIAEREGVSFQRVQQILQKALDCARTALVQDGADYTE